MSSHEIEGDEETDEALEDWTEHWEGLLSSGRLLIQAAEERIRWLKGRTGADKELASVEADLQKLLESQSQYQRRFELSRRRLREYQDS